MSKREIKKKKLDQRILFGVVTSVSIVGALGWLLVRHKQKSDEERLEEIDARHEARMVLLTRKIDELEHRLESEKDKKTRKILQELIDQSKKLQQTYQAETELPLKVRLVLEKVREADAEIEDRLVELEEVAD